MTDTVTIRHPIVYIDYTAFKILNYHKQQITLDYR